MRLYTAFCTQQAAQLCIHAALRGGLAHRYSGNACLQFSSDTAERGERGFTWFRSAENTCLFSKDNFASSLCRGLVVSLLSARLRLGWEPTAEGFGVTFSRLADLSLKVPVNEGLHYSRPAQAQQASSAAGGHNTGVSAKYRYAASSAALHSDWLDQ